MFRLLSISTRRPGATAVMVFMLSSLLLYPAALAQNSTSGTIVGKVYDASGAPLANVRVAIINELNGNSRARVTDAAGSYTFSFIPPGTYRITATLLGYLEGSITEFRVPLNTTSVVRAPLITLQASSTATTPTTPTPTQPTPTPTRPTPAPTTPPGQTTAGQPVAETLVNTTDATRGGNFTARQVETLPLGGTTDMRTFDEFALLVPGVAPPPYTPGVRGPGVGFGIGTAGQFSVNGLRARSNNFTVDGSDNNDPDVGVRRQGFVALVPQSIESIQEFQISTLLWDAEQGRNFGSQVNAVSKDGTIGFHGQAYGFFTDSKLNARNFFDYTDVPESGGENPYTRTQAGFVLGGPIAANRTQFFTSFEYLIVNTSIEQHFATPSAAERRFLGLPAFQVLQPFPGTSPITTFSTTRGATPLGLNALSFYPLPNNPGGPYGASTYSEVLPADGRGAVASFKVTHQFSEDHTLYGRYNFTDDNRILPSVNRAIRSTIESDTRTQNLSLILNSTLTAAISNQARFSFGRTRLDFLEYPDSPFLFSSATREVIGGLPGVFLSQTGPIGELIIEPYSPVGVDVYTFPQNRANNTFQFADSVSATVRNHQVKFGADIRRIQLNSRVARNYRPLVVYSNAVLVIGALDQTNDPPFPFVPGDIEPQLILGSQLATIGLPSSIFQTVTRGTPDPTIALRFTEYNFFFNDNWRVRPNFTLDFGVRYEYNTIPREANDRIERALALADLPTTGRSRGDTPSRISAFNAAVNAYRSILSDRSRIYDGDRNNFGPHVGFAWAPGVRAETVIRGGYGVYYDAILGAVVSQSRNIFPNEVPLNVAPSAIGFDVLVLNNPAFLQLVDGPDGRPLNQPIPLITPGTGNQIGGTSADFGALLGQLFAQQFGGLSFTLPSRNLRTPYAQHWHLTIEREAYGGYLVSGAYVGTKGTKLTRLTTPNLGSAVTPIIPLAVGATVGGRPPVPFPEGTPPIVLAGPTLQPVRPRPSLGAFQIFENSASSSYHALQLEARKRYSAGYQFTASYTWSHAIDDVSDVFPIAGAPILPQNSFNYSLERADANYDVRHRFAASFVWDLPFYRGSTADAADWLGGWQLASIFQANTGQPFTLNAPFDVNLDGNLTDRPATTEGLIFNDGHGPQRVALPANRQVTSFFAFGVDGAVGRNTVRADNFINWDVALNKVFRFTESQNLVLRAEFFNVLNRANFGIPIRTIGSPGFGSAVETANPARTIQFALKYRF